MTTISPTEYRTNARSMLKQIGMLIATAVLGGFISGWGIVTGMRIEMAEFKKDVEYMRKDMIRGESSNTILVNHQSRIVALEIISNNNNQSIIRLKEATKEIYTKQDARQDKLDLIDLIKSLRP
jgi:ABC-type dipeptide/oligopeptide/nickel transport system permease component